MARKGEYMDPRVTAQGARGRDPVDSQQKGPTPKKKEDTKATRDRKSSGGWKKGGGKAPKQYVFKNLFPQSFYKYFSSKSYGHVIKIQTFTTQ